MAIFAATPEARVPPWPKSLRVPFLVGGDRVLEWVDKGEDTPSTTELSMWFNFARFAERASPSSKRSLEATTGRRLLEI